MWCLGGGIGHKASHQASPAIPSGELVNDSADQEESDGDQEEIGDDPQNDGLAAEEEEPFEVNREEEEEEEEEDKEEKEDEDERYDYSYEDEEEDEGEEGDKVMEEIGDDKGELNMMKNINMSSKVVHSSSWQQQGGLDASRVWLQSVP